MYLRMAACMLDLLRHPCLIVSPRTSQKQEPGPAIWAPAGFAIHSPATMATIWAAKIIVSE